MNNMYRIIPFLVLVILFIIGTVANAAPDHLAPYDALTGSSEAIFIYPRPTRTPIATSNGTPSATPVISSTPTPTVPSSRGTPTPTPLISPTPTDSSRGTPNSTPVISLTPTNPSRGTPSATPSPTPSPSPTNTSAAPVPYLEYQIYDGTIQIDPDLPPVLPGGRGDYAAIFEKYNLCDLIANSLVDEVWIWAGDGDGVTKPHLWEWTTSGPGWGGDTPDCGKVVTTMTFNYLREVDVALESYNHRLEGFFSTYFTCDFSTATWPWNGSDVWPFCGNLLSDEFGFVARPFSENNFIGGCGDAHHPPNILTNEDYIFSDQTTVDSICPGWSQDGSAIPVPINCEAWGCTHWGFQIWWMQNVPGVNNINRDRYGNLHPNWWSYLFGPPDESKVFSRSLPGVQWMLQRNNFATLDQGLQNGSNGLVSLNNSLTEPALTTRQVFVIYYPGYGGTPRAEIQVLTEELIGLLKQGTTYHGYEYQMLTGIFFGQDGASYAGVQCNTGTTPDNVHIRVEGFRTDKPISSYKVEDTAGGGAWSNPCNPVSNWLLYVSSQTEGQADLYFKPFRVAPDGTFYTITITYDDGTKETLNVIGSHVEP